MTSELHAEASATATTRPIAGYSVLVLAFNESVNIERCLDSLRECDDVVVLDSMSTDGTAECIKARPVRLLQRRFDTFAGQRNWAIDSITFKHRWVLHLDADERMTPALHRELLNAAAQDAKSAFLLANKLIFMDRWIRHASMYPYYQARFLRLGESRFVQVGHGQTLDHTARGVGTIKEPYLHYNFSKGISDWLSRHNRYSSDEARRIASRSMPWGKALVHAVRGASGQDRQQARKRLADSLPAKPLWRFLYLYVARLGFLDGGPGFHYCMLMAIYDYLIALKSKELQSRGRN
jgi:glycosyltransferase involved in cell wall biosynthesis